MARRVNSELLLVGSLPADKSPAVTDLREFNDRGHSLTIDHGWREIADEVLSLTR
jgi:hypothetical protein